jgi:purine-binding chemotaxis protein CheW
MLGSSAVAQDLLPADREIDSVARLMQTAAKPRCMEVELAGGLYGLSVDDVKEVIGLRAITRVFHAPPVIAGVANLRGEVLTVIDAALLLTGESSARATSARIVVLRVDQELRCLAGVLVDRLGALREMPGTGLAQAPSTLPPARARLIAGVIPSAPPCSVLDVAELFRAPELSEFGLAAHGEP